MNKQNALKWITLGAKGISFVTGLGVYVNQLPASWLPIAALVFGGASILKDVVNRVGDLLDDGQLNSSFKG
jgi:hypothetical protein